MGTKRKERERNLQKRIDSKVDRIWGHSNINTLHDEVGDAAGSARIPRPINNVDQNFISETNRFTRSNKVPNTHTHAHFRNASPPRNVKAHAGAAQVLSLQLKHIGDTREISASTARLILLQGSAPITITCRAGASTPHHQTPSNTCQATMATVLWGKKPKR